MGEIGRTFHSSLKQASHGLDPPCIQPSKALPRRPEISERVPSIQGLGFDNTSGISFCIGTSISSVCLADRVLMRGHTIGCSSPPVSRRICRFHVSRCTLDSRQHHDLFNGQPGKKLCWYPARPEGSSSWAARRRRQANVRLAV